MGEAACRPAGYIRIGPRSLIRQMAELRCGPEVSLPDAHASPASLPERVPLSGVIPAWAFGAPDHPLVAGPFLLLRCIRGPYATLPKLRSTAPVGGLSPARRQPCAIGPPGSSA
jgi:hypothetical protein